MSKFFTSSIGQKFFMSITGVFLILFLMVHLTLNSLLLFGDGELFNKAATFMGANPLMKIIEPILAIGFIIHIFYATFITLKNQYARPIKYKKIDRRQSTSLASRNMYILGALLFIFLVLHLSNFFWKIKFGTIETITYDGTEFHNIYAMVSGLFIKYLWYDIFYIIGATLLGFHLSHGFWSAFQTIGFNNDIWIIRLKFIANIFAIIIAAGFSIIPIYFFVTNNLL